MDDRYRVNVRWLVFRHVSLVSTEGRDAPVWQGATTENIEHI
jgi:hypothetical protein